MFCPLSLFSAKNDQGRRVLFFHRQRRLLLFLTGFTKPCQALFMVSIMCYDMTIVKHILYTLPMPRVPKQILPPLNLSSETIGNRLARIRKAKGLTQEGLAEKIGITRSVIANYEKDRLRIYDEMLIRIAMALSVSTDDLLGLTDSLISPEQSPSLRLSRRLSKIDRLPASEQKALLKTIDTYLKGLDT